MKEFIFTAVVVLTVMAGGFYAYLWSTGFKTTAQIQAEERQECADQCKKEGAASYTIQRGCMCIFSMKGKE